METELSVLAQVLPHFARIRTACYYFAPYPLGFVRIDSSFRDPSLVNIEDIVDVVDVGWYALPSTVANPHYISNS